MVHRDQIHGVFPRASHFFDVIHMPSDGPVDNVKEMEERRSRSTSFAVDSNLMMTIYREMTASQQSDAPMLIEREEETPASTSDESDGTSSTSNGTVHSIHSPMVSPVALGDSIRDLLGPADPQDPTYPMGIDSSDGWSDMPPARTPRPPADAPVKTVGVFGTWLNVTNNMIGAGVLGVAYAFMQVGALAGVALLAAIGAISVVSLTFLAHAADSTGLYSFMDVGHAAFGRRFGFLTELTLLAAALGVLTVYLVVLTDYTSVLVGLIYPVPRILVVLGLALLIVPVLPIRRLGLFRASSSVGVVAVATAVVVLVAKLQISGPHAAVATTAFPWVVRPVGVVSACSVLIFGFAVHLNSLNYYKVLRNRSVARFAGINAASVAACLIFYTIAGLAGSVLLGPDVPANVLQGLGTDIASLAGRACILATVLATVPLLLFAARMSALRLLPRVNAARPHPVIWTLAGLAIVAGLAVIAWALPDLASAYGLIGSLFGMLVVYVLPAVFMIRVGRPGRLAIAGAVVVIVIGVVTGVGGFINGVVTFIQGWLG